MWCKSVRIGILTAALLMASGIAAAAQDRFVRTFGPESGLTSAPVWALAQDSSGFLWVGTHGGLFRYDGTEFRRWAADSIQQGVFGIAVSPDGRIAAIELAGRVFEVTSSGARAISTRLDDQNPAFGHIAWDRRNTLWIIDGNSVRYLGSGGGWQKIPAEQFNREQPSRVKTNRQGAVDVVTRSGLWRIDPYSAPRHLTSGQFIDILQLEDGRTLALAADAVIEVSDDGRIRHTRWTFGPGHSFAVIERHGTLWVSRDNSLVAIRPGEPPETLPNSGLITNGGAMLVDREGSLWMGSNALHQFPEPETWVWRDVPGLQYDLSWARFLEKSHHTVWAGTWSGQFSIRWTPTGWTFDRETSSLAALCPDASGAIWTAEAGQDGRGKMVEIRGSVRRRRPIESRGGLRGCALSHDGSLWLGTAFDLLNFDPAQGSIRILRSPPGTPPGTERRPMLHDSQDRLWVCAAPNRICSAPVTELIADTADAWSCDTIPGTMWLSGMMELRSGNIWASTDGQGVLVLGNAGWRPLSIDKLQTKTVFAMTPSSDSSAWLAGHGSLLRLLEHPDGGAEAVEWLTQWHGVPAASPSDLLEEEDGSLLIAYDGGVIRVPRQVRFSVRPIPPVALVEASADGVPVEVRGPIRLPHNRNRVELRFAALSFRDPALLRHQVRLGPDEPWSESHGSPSFRWVDLRAGDHQVEYRASLDGVNWSPEPVRFAFTVLRPWYFTPWAIGVALLLATGIVWTLYHARVAYLLGLERQRTRIAMDLHDEVGSGLASVGILSGVLAADSLDPDERRRAAKDIATAAEELGNALSDIVWSLDPHAATLTELASRLAEHGERLCAAGEIQFTRCFPGSWPAGHLDVAIRRNVLLIGLEALHNAVRHARGSEVVLTLLPVDHRWMLAVHDDGVGLAQSSRESGRGGHGLRGMRRRAEEIGADLELRSAPDQGTSVTLRFGLRVASSRWNAGLSERLRRFIGSRTA